MKGVTVFPSVFGRLFTSASGNPLAVGISIKTYRNQVMRDLRWLLNSRCQPRTARLHAYGHAAASTLNYGMQDLVGALDSQIEPEDVIEAVRTAIFRYEPRIIPATLAVSLVGGSHAFDVDFFALEIQGDLWALPVNEPLTLQSQWSGLTARWEVA